MRKHEYKQGRKRKTGHYYENNDNTYQSAYFSGKGLLRIFTRQFHYLS
ncbi:hypothetical protein L3C95_20055 [Chitinophaga filiformis]|nr:hypothetical protein [Chitinophaga filiformis]MCF6405208.1 hypothetical protein [Chitinophaga filiformis]